ncbi:probable disease resistance protein At5g66900 isoform X2 [Camellia sinensis]|uniref:probable disease resistance protein At5g66900 isoform X2 n=1 Tax=Camellia sinensis TaxID=4442 RepID=UPI001035B072|nr:probable disease resistance protein At5g66900 isoform X2 [Camellia sinensis]
MILLTSIELQIVRGCGGFPLALEVVGKSLKGESEVTWKNKLNRWSEGQSIFYSDAAPNGATDILKRLQTTLDDLDVKIKECYLDLASFPEDQRIPAMALVDMWVELYNLDEVSAFANIHELSDRNLLNLVPTRKDASEINGYYNEHFVTQHDLLREVATHQIDQNPIHRSRLIMDIGGNDLPKWWTEQGQHPIRLVSISTGEISNGHNMQLSKVEVLLLNIQIRNYTLPLLMEKMDQLKVLIVTNYGFCSAEISNFPLLGHLSSLRRIRFEHISISSIAKTMLQLKNLQKISLVMCKFDDAFGNCTIQIADMLPNLVEIVIDCCNDLVEFPAWLCNISSLKRLDITNCHELIALPEAFGKLENLEVLRLHACTKLLELPESIGRLQKFRFLDLSDCISISKLTERMGELSSLRKLNVRGGRGLSELPSSVKNLKQLEDLICDEETGYLWENYKIHLPNLKFHVLKEDVNLDWLK